MWSENLPSPGDEQLEGSWVLIFSSFLYRDYCPLVFLSSNFFLLGGVEFVEGLRLWFKGDF